MVVVVGPVRIVSCGNGSPLGVKGVLEDGGLDAVLQQAHRLVLQQVGTPQVGGLAHTDRGVGGGRAVVATR